MDFNLQNLHLPHNSSFDIYIGFKLNIYSIKKEVSNDSSTCYVVDVSCYGNDTEA